MSLLAPGSSFGPYTVEGFVAGGGMGRVYAGTHGVYGTPVALKVLHERFAADPRWQRRFSDEGLLGLALKHPHVLAARELVHQGSDVALVLDLVRGGQTLASVVEREHPGGLGAGAALGVFLRVVSGVEYLHERGVIHGDLKPENVLVEGPVREPAAWVPRVTDFGTVALIADPVVIDGRPAVVASPRYASPEHLRGVDHLDARSDTYALGLLLHWLLSGRHASGARTVSEALDFVHHPIPLVALVDQPDPILSLVERATEPNPARRFQDCRALALAARDVLDTLGLSLTLEDLQADLATELIEGRQVAPEPPADQVDPAASDSEIDLGPPLPGDDPGATTAEPVVVLAPLPSEPPAPEPPPPVESPPAPEPAPRPVESPTPPVEGPTPPARPSISLLLASAHAPADDEPDSLVVGVRPIDPRESDEDLPTVSAGARVVLRPTEPPPRTPATLDYSLPGVEDHEEPEDPDTDPPTEPSPRRPVALPPPPPKPEPAPPKPEPARAEPAPEAAPPRPDPVARAPEPLRAEPPRAEPPRAEPPPAPSEGGDTSTRSMILGFLALALVGSVLGLLTAWAVWAAGLLGT